MSVWRTFLADDERQVSVVDEDALAGLDDVDDVLVVEPQQVLGARLLVLVVDRHRYRLTGRDRHLGVRALYTRRRRAIDHAQHLYAVVATGRPTPRQRQPITLSFGCAKLSQF